MKKSLILIAYNAFQQGLVDLVSNESNNMYKYMSNFKFPIKDLEIKSDDSIEKIAWSIIDSYAINEAREIVDEFDKKGVEVGDALFFCLVENTKRELENLFSTLKAVAKMSDSDWALLSLSQKKNLVKDCYNRIQVYPCDKMNQPVEQVLDNALKTGVVDAKAYIKALKKEADEMVNIYPNSFVN